MARCCCCFGLRTGSLLVGLIFLVVDVAALVWSALGLAEKVQPWPDQVRYRFESQTLLVALWVALVLAAVSVLCDLLLIQAAARRTRCGQVCWLIWNGLLFTVATLALLVLLGLAIWLLVDASAADKLGLNKPSLDQLWDELTLTEEERRQAKQYTYLALLIAAIVGLIIMAILWGWFSAVDRNQRRLRHTTVIVKTQHMHTSRL